MNTSSEQNPTPTFTKIEPIKAPFSQIPAQDAVTTRPPAAKNDDHFVGPPQKQS